MQIRMDIWHFMRRMAGRCTSESHRLYRTFMSKLSSCIYEWDPTDAKLGELRKAGVLYPTYDAARNSTSLEELARHCRRSPSAGHTLHC